MHQITKLLFALILFSITSTAQDKKKSWDVSNPEGDWGFKDLKLSTDEGTWMNLDVSPDGKHIAFDMLGDIYIMDIKGGNAKS